MTGSDTIEVLLLTRSGPSCILQSRKAHSFSAIAPHFSTRTPLCWAGDKKNIRLWRQDRGGCRITLGLPRKVLPDQTPHRTQLLWGGVSGINGGSTLDSIFDFEDSNSELRTVGLSAEPWGQGSVANSDIRGPSENREDRSICLKAEHR